MNEEEKKDGNRQKNTGMKQKLMIDNCRNKMNEKMTGNTNDRK